MTTFILASASPARRAVLTAAGVVPEVRVANLNEDKLIAGMAGSEPETIVTELAVAKAKAVIRTLDAALTADSVVLACDSMLRLGKSLLGKPLTGTLCNPTSRKKPRRWPRLAACISTAPPPTRSVATSPSKT